jgi:hypothetical protein
VTRRRRASIAARDIDQRIRPLRGERIILGADLAPLYEVELRALTQAVKRNRSRFPPDFLFQLTDEEWADLKSQSVTSSWGGSRRGLPYAFTEQGVAMLSSVLRSRRAVAVNVEIMRAFVRVRRAVAQHADLARRLDELEQRYDERFGEVFDAIRALVDPPEEPPRPARRIGFRAADRNPS